MLNIATAKTANNINAQGAVPNNNKSTQKIRAIKPKAKPIARPTAISQASKKNNHADKNLAKAAAEVRALFGGPQNKALDVPFSLRTRLVTCLSVFCSLLIPTVYAGVLVSIAAATIAVIVTGFNGFSSWPLLVPLALVIPPVLLLLSALTVLAAPLFNLPKAVDTTISVKAKDEPKLFMLVAAIAKLINAPVPNVIKLTTSPDVRCRIPCSFSEFFKFKQPLSSHASLTIGAPLLQSTSIAVTSAAIASELSLFAKSGDKQTQRSYLLTRVLLDFARRLNKPTRLLSEILWEASSNISSKPISELLRKFATAATWLEKPLGIYFSSTTRWVEKFTFELDNRPARVQTVLVGNDAARELIKNRIDLAEALRNTLARQLHDNPNQRYVDNIIDLIERDFQTKSQREKPAASTPPKNQAQTGLINSAQPMHALVSQLPQLGQALTQTYYKDIGLSLDKIEIYSIEQLAQKKAEENRLSDAAKRYFGNWFSSDQLWLLPKETEIGNLEQKAIIARLNKCIDRVRYLSPDRTNTVSNYHRLIKQIIELKAAKKTETSGGSFQFQSCTDLSSDLDKELARRMEKLNTLETELRQHNGVMGERLALGLALESNRKACARRLYKSLICFEGLDARLKGLLHDAEEFRSLLRNKPKKGSRHYDLYHREFAQRIRENIKHVIKRSQQCPYHTVDKRFANLADYLHHELGTLSTNINDEELIGKAKILHKSATRAYKRISQNAADIAGKVEEEFGIDKIKRV